MSITAAATSIASILNTVKTLIAWITDRGIKRDRLQALLNAKAENSTDFTAEEVQTELDITASELAETKRLLAEDNEE